MAIRYRPRNNKVIIRIVDVGVSKGGVALPDQASEGKAYIVEAVGPDVDNLEVGDRVLMVGKINEDYTFLPREKSLIIIAESNVLLIIEEEDQG
jgi:co-chaperonin GroES (HSP10)